MWDIVLRNLFESYANVPLFSKHKWDVPVNNLFTSPLLFWILLESPISAQNSEG